jgi:hypothetical protein
MNAASNTFANLTLMEVLAWLIWKNFGKHYLH